jgi:hypothetical protein
MARPLRPPGSQSRALLGTGLQQTRGGRYAAPFCFRPCILRFFKRFKLFRSERFQVRASTAAQRKNSQFFAFWCAQQACCREKPKEFEQVLSMGQGRLNPTFEMGQHELGDCGGIQRNRSRVNVGTNTEIFKREKHNELCRTSCVKYVCWTMHITILMRITSANNSAVPQYLNVGSGLHVKVNPEPPNPLADNFRSGDTRIITNLRGGTFSGDVYNRIEFSWAHVVPSSLTSSQAMGRYDPPFLHAYDTVLALQRNPAGSKGVPKRGTARPPKLSRSIEPA